MQTPTISTLSIATLPVSADPSVGGTSLVGTVGADISFVEVLQGQAGDNAPLLTTAPVAARPMPMVFDLSALPQPADIDPAAEILPVAAATGKFLPALGKGTAIAELAEQIPATTFPIIGTKVATLIASMLPTSKTDGLKPVEDAEPDAIVDDCELIDPSLHPAALVLPQPLPLPSAQTPLSEIVPATVDVASATQVAVPALPKLEMAPKANGTGTAQAPAQPVAAAPTTPAAGWLAVSITAGSAAVAVPTEHAVKVMASDERTGQPAAPVIAPLPVRTALLSAGSGETSQRGAREDAPRRDSAVSLAAPAASAASASVADLLSAMPVTPAAAQDRAATISTVATLPVMPTAAPDRAEVIAHVVDRLMAAREVGLGTLASIAIENRDFGDLTVSFSDKGNSLEVSVTAADADKQRALAAALSTAERPVTREPATQTSSNTASATMQQDRSVEGQLARDSGSRQPRGETMTEQRHAGHSASPATEAETAAPQRSGIYV